MKLLNAIMDVFYKSKDYSFQIQTFNPNSYWCELCKAVHPEKKLTYVTLTGVNVEKPTLVLCKKCYKKAIKGVIKNDSK